MKVLVVHGMLVVSSRGRRARWLAKRVIGLVVWGMLVVSSLRRVEMRLWRRSQFLGG